jgi:hypothetical protein
MIPRAAGAVDLYVGVVAGPAVGAAGVEQ